MYNKRRLLYLHLRLREIAFWDLTTEVERVMLVWKGERVLKIRVVYNFLEN